jgi:hypothetical protein
MSSEVKWTLLVGLMASFLAATLMALLTQVSGTLSLLGWAIFFESLQLPVIAAARRGRLDPCTAWLRRVLLESRNDA